LTDEHRVGIHISNIIIRTKPTNYWNTEVQMLVLSRKQSQRIRLGDSITVTVVRVCGDKVRLGIEAPPDMLVLRDELDRRDPDPALVPSRRASARLANSA
jgi:carbon storage regulator